MVRLLVSTLERQSLNVNRANSSDVFWRLISTIFTFMRTFISEKASKQKVLGVVSWNLRAIRGLIILQHNHVGSQHNINTNYRLRGVYHRLSTIFGTKTEFHWMYSFRYLSSIHFIGFAIYFDTCYSWKGDKNTTKLVSIRMNRFAVHKRWSTRLATRLVRSSVSQRVQLSYCIAAIVFSLTNNCVEILFSQGWFISDKTQSVRINLRNRGLI